MSKVGDLTAQKKTDSRSEVFSFCLCSAPQVISEESKPAAVGSSSSPSSTSLLSPVVTAGTFFLDFSFVLIAETLLLFFFSFSSE